MSVEAAKVESAIEQKFLDIASPALRVELEPQVEFYVDGWNFRGDFVARADDRVVLIECDGRQFHDFNRDQKRDILLLTSRSVTDIVRLRGCDIFFNPEGTLDALRWCVPFLFVENASPATADFDSLMLLAGMLQGSVIKPTYRANAPVGMAVIRAKEIKDQHALRLLAVTPDRKEVVIQAKSPRWDWRYEGPKFWAVDDAIRFYLEEEGVA